MAIDAYFIQTKKPRICELCLWLGFNSRSTLYTYEGYGPEFSDTIKRARLRIEDHYESRLQKRGDAGSIFALKNLGWKDNMSVEGVALPSITVVRNSQGNGSDVPTQ